MHLIPNKHGPVTHLSISANNKYVAFATQRSLICVYAVNLSAQATPQVIVTHLSTDQSVQVSCIHWTPDEKQFYYGDTRGQVNLVLLSSFIGHSLLFNMSVHPLLYLDSPIVQIDDFESLLLVSNSTKCILCNTEYEEYKQVSTSWVYSTPLCVHWPHFLDRLATVHAMALSAPVSLSRHMSRYIHRASIVPAQALASGK